MVRKLQQDGYFLKGEREAWTPFVMSTLHLLARLDGELKEAFGFSHLDYGLMVMMRQAPGGRVKMKWLAERFGQDPSTITYRISRLETLGLVRRETPPEDGRVFLVSLTPKGETLLAQAVAFHAQGVRRHFLDHLSVEEQAWLGRVFGRLLARQSPPLHLGGIDGLQDSGPKRRLGRAHQSNLKVASRTDPA